ncbi:MAG: hypothetical protein SV487_07835 [Thermodesulfobacteriota bacterium]|nr:hypothetical protein [Thermodesulfobacteriota bacterium]
MTVSWALGNNQIKINYWQEAGFEAGMFPKEMMNEVDKKGSHDKDLSLEDERRQDERRYGERRRDERRREDRRAQDRRYKDRRLAKLIVKNPELSQYLSPEERESLRRLLDEDSD